MRDFLGHGAFSLTRKSGRRRKAEGERRKPVLESWKWLTRLTVVDAWRKVVDYLEAGGGVCRAFRPIATKIANISEHSCDS